MVFKLINQNQLGTAPNYPKLEDNVITESIMDYGQKKIHLS